MVTLGRHRVEALAGTLLGRALEQPGCPICWQQAEVADWRLWYLLREGPDTLGTSEAGLSALGLCRQHLWAIHDEEYRDLGSRVQTAMLCELALSALDRRWSAAGGDTPARLGCPPAPCPLCQATAQDERRACASLFYSLRFPDVRAHYAAGSGLCLRHLAVALPGAEAGVARLLLESAARRLREVSDDPMQLCAVLHGRDPGQPTERAATRPRLTPPLAPGIGCPACAARARAESTSARRLLERVASGAKREPTMNAWLCGQHAWALLARAPSRAATVFALEARAVMAELGRLLAEMPRPERQAQSLLGRLFRARRPHRPALPRPDCNICAAGSAGLAQGGADSGRYCLPHARPIVLSGDETAVATAWPTLHARLMALSAGIDAYIRKQQWERRGDAWGEAGLAVPCAVAFLVGEHPEPLCLDAPGGP